MWIGVHVVHGLETRRFFGLLGRGSMGLRDCRSPAALVRLTLEVYYVKHVGELELFTT